MEPTIRDLPMQTRSATIAPATFDADKRTVEVCWTTGARVPRYSFWTEKRYEEELVVDAKSVRMERLTSGAAPLLDVHSSYELKDVIGVVERAWLKGGEGFGVVRFSGVESVAETVAKVREGTLKNISVGYQVHQYEITERDNGPDLYRAVDWTPMELSIVPIPADAGATIRADGRNAPCRLVLASPPHVVAARMRMRARHGGLEV